MNGITAPVVSGELADLEWKGVVGAGRYGMVYKAFWPTLGKDIAVKRIEGDVDHEKCLQEIKLWEKLDHKYIVKLYKTDIVEYTKGHSVGYMVSLLMEYGENGSLYDYLKAMQKARAAMSEELIVQWAKQMADALVYLRSQSVIHRDLKSSNIVLDKDYNIKLCDFGSSRYMSRTRCVSLHGTFAWMAPELMRGQTICNVPKMGYTYCDIYSYAMVLWEMVALDIPFRELENEYQIVFAVCQHGDRPQVPGHCPGYIKELITAGWDENPLKRPSLGEITHCLTTRDSTVLQNRELSDEVCVSPPYQGLSPIPESPCSDTSEPPVFPTQGNNSHPERDKKPLVKDLNDNSEAAKTQNKTDEILQARRAATVASSNPNEALRRQKSREVSKTSTKRLSMPEDEKNLTLMLGTPAEFWGRGLSSV